MMLHPARKLEPQANPTRFSLGSNDVSSEVQKGIADFQKREASNCNNAAWSPIEKVDLEPADILRLLALAATARHYWHEVGNPNNIAHADLLLAWAMARAGASGAATDLADTALSYFEEAGEAWELAFAHAAKAVTCAAEDDIEGLRHHYSKGEELGRKLTDPDAGIFDAAFKTVPNPGN